MSDTEMLQKNKRLVSLDVLRGLTVACMILVNNGAGPDTYAPLKHSVWNGLTPCDLVFPFFLFMVGVSIFVSLNKSGFKPTSSTIMKILKRTVLLFVIGLLLHMWDMATKGNWSLFSELRVWGVLQRIALCYGIVSLLALWLDWKKLLCVAVVLLVGYSFLLSSAYGYEMSEQNIIAIVDRYVFGQAHLYHKSPVDPEGLLSTFPAISHTVIGFVVGRILVSPKDLNRKVKEIVSYAFSIGLIGVNLIMDGIPLNKRIWSASYVLVTCAIAMGTLVVLLLIIDKWEKKRWCKLFQAFGMNAFFIYVLSEIIAPALSHWGLKAPIYEGINALVSNTYSASLIYALLFVAFMAIVASILWKKEIVIKI